MKGKIALLIELVLLFVLINTGTLNADVLDLIRNTPRKDLFISAKLESPNEVQALNWKLQLDFSEAVTVQEIAEFIKIEVNGIHSLKYKQGFEFTDNIGSSIYIKHKNPIKNVVIIPVGDKHAGDYKVTIKEGLIDTSNNFQLNKAFVFKYDVNDIFTITKIETFSKRNRHRIRLHFSSPIANIPGHNDQNRYQYINGLRNVMKKSIKLFPYTMIIHTDIISGNIIDIYSNFKQGQNYKIAADENLKSYNGKKYVKGVNSFIIPDYPPLIKYSDAGSIIERDSRQMLSVRLMNVDEILYEGLKIPPLLIPTVINLRDSLKYEKLSANLDKQLAEIKLSLKL